jgi:hypothetical protein
MAETIKEATLKYYYDIGKQAYEHDDWVTAAEYLFTYQELDKINNPNKPSEVAEFIKYSENKIHERPVTVKGIRKDIPTE